MSRPLRPMLLPGVLSVFAVLIVAGALVLFGGAREPALVAATAPDTETAVEDPAATEDADEDPVVEEPESEPAPEDAGDTAAEGTGEGPDPEDASETDQDPNGDDPPAQEPDTSPTPALPPGPPTDQRTLEVRTEIGGNISPKSVVSSPGGLFLAQNMMYRHTVTVYDRSYELVATIPDTVNPTEFGLDGPDAEVRGAPVEAAFTPDGRYAYVSNYAMYGAGYDREGTDTCSPEDGYDDSTVYRLDLETLAIDQVIPVGSVPKYVAVTPDGSRVLVTNWCSYDLSVIDVATGTEVERVELGRYPRGIAVTSDSSTAYIALMGTYDILVLDLDDGSSDRLAGIGRGPRHLVLSPDDRTLYATINSEGVVAKIDLATQEVVTTATGQAPRSMDIAADGRSLYVVNYLGDTVSKVRTSDMSVLQTLDVADKPIGITYDGGTGQVWVASYSGVLTVMDDR
ncbi:MAG: YncE family protein [Nitriliruptoraceae bacterium]